MVVKTKMGLAILFLTNYRIVFIHLPTPMVNGSRNDPGPSLAFPLGKWR